jgi:peptidoglycan-associated lipoprotein
MNKSHLRQLLVFLAVLALGLMSTACKSSSKSVPPPAPPAPPEVVERSAPDVVEPPADFVTEEPETQELPGDTDELNRIAQERGWIRDAFFEYDSSTLNQQAREGLQASATWLKGYPQYGLLIEGHCDERGTEQYNLALGDRRASAARDYLVSLGIDAGRIRTISYGEERPFDTGTTETAYAKNRRAHLVLTR